MDLQTKGKHKQLASWLAVVCWYGVAAWICLAYLVGIAVPAWKASSPGLAGWMIKAQCVLGVIVLAAAFVLIQVGWSAAWRWTGVLKNGSTQVAAGKAFPSPPTQQIGLAILSFVVLCLVAVFIVLHRELTSDVQQALLMVLAAGIGSSISTILGFLEHASEKADFKPEYMPWYVGRPVMGLLLGLLFFFVLRGGMLGVLPNIDASKLNPYGLAAIGGMVGLFTKHAVEKLQEVFDVLFQTKSDVQGDLPKK